MSSIETYFTITAGKAKYADVEALRNAVSALPDGRYLNKIEKVTNARSLEQNNSIWGIPYQYFKRALTESGNYKDISKLQIHEFCMHHCLPADYKERILNEWKADPGMTDLNTGEIFKAAFRLTTTKMKTIDAMHYYENIQQFYSEWFSSGEPGDVIPDPDPKLNKRRMKKVSNF